MERAKNTGPLAAAVERKRRRKRDSVSDINPRAIVTDGERNPALLQRRTEYPATVRAADIQSLELFFGQLGNAVLAGKKGYYEGYYCIFHEGNRTQTGPG